MIAPSQNNAPGKAREPTALVLLATYNGAKYLDEQLASIAAQTGVVVHLLVSDDGSTDDTLAQLERWKNRWTKGRFDVIAGPRSGFADNFRSLVLGSTADYDYVAFSDQDDVWDPDKLAVAIGVLSCHDPSRPAVYCSRSRLIDENGREFGMSPLFPYRPSFRNAIVQSLAGGNTMVLNRAGLVVLQESARRTSFLMHDWWTYLVVSGAGGFVYYDRQPHIGYRQHGGNAVGGGIGILERPKRLMELLGGKFVAWSDQNTVALKQCLDLLDDDSQSVLEDFENMRKATIFSIPRRLLQSGIYRQTVKGNIALGVAALLHRL